MAKGQRKSSNEPRKPNSNPPKKDNVSAPTRKPGGLGPISSLLALKNRNDHG